MQSVPAARQYTLLHSILVPKVDQFFFCFHAFPLPYLRRFDQSFGDLCSYSLTNKKLEY